MKSSASSSSDPGDATNFHHSSGGVNSVRQCAQQAGTHVTKKDAVTRKNQVGV